MPEERSFTLPGVLSAIPSACDFISAAAEHAGMDDRSSYHCQMAVDEWCTNVIEHGFGEDRAEHRIEIRLRLDAAKMTVTIRDDGPPFDPTTLPAVDPTRPLEAREPGGLGWHFIVKTMNEVRYAYQDGHNVLTLVKRGAMFKPMSGGPSSPFPLMVTAAGVLVVRPEGRVDSSVGHQLDEALHAQIEAGYRRLVVDLDGVTYISSTGLKALLNTLRRLQAVQGAIALCGLRPRVWETFEMSGFHTLFSISTSVEEAVQVVDAIG